MDAIPAAVTSLLNALQSASQGASAAPVPALLALAGQDVSMLLLGQTPGGGVSLALPSGQVITAQGQLPYADGTQLLLRIQAGTGDAPLRLQTLQASPQTAPAILAPLLQGEAATLQAGLAQPDSPPGLADLAELAQMLGPQAADPTRIQAALDTLAPPSLAALKTILELPQSASLSSVASALDTWLASPAPAGARPASGGADLLQRFQAAVDRHPELPAAQGDALVQWLKPLLNADSRSAAAQAQTPSTEPTPAQALQQQLAGRGGTPPEQPATWEAWIGTSIKTLNDPAVMPQTAAFHAAQAKEGTAFYELPLPWAPQHPLQMWVESERDPRDPGRSQPETQRVLLGLSFTNLGETRLGIAKSGAGLQVRVWTEHPELLEGSKGAVEGELRDLGSSVDLKIMTLSPGPGGTIPSLRSQVTGATLEAMG
jgi:hypothetical protein